jgi:hypothetical protein
VHDCTLFGEILLYVLKSFIEELYNMVNTMQCIDLCEQYGGSQWV